MELDRTVRRMAEEMGADFFGVADLTKACETIVAQGGRMVAEFPRAITVGIGLFHAIVDELPDMASRLVAMNYQHHCYDLINERLDILASRAAAMVQRAGHRVLPVPASQTVDDERLCGIFSHKLAAHLSGLGWIGKSCLLITPEMGPRVRWATVLTDAPLSITGEPMEERCGACEACVDICPVKAFTGRAFHEGEPREVRYAAHKCDRFLSEREQTMGVDVCGLCLYVCPQGRNGDSAEDQRLSDCTEPE